MARITKEKWKIYGNVFDEFTISTVRKLIGQHMINGIESPVKIGKEANVFTALCDDGPRRIIKIYRLESCNFNKMYSYIRSDPRFMDLKRQRRQIIFSWVKREYKNLLLARKAGVRVPAPLSFNNHVLVMELIGNDSVAPQLKDTLPADPEAFFDDIIANVSLLYKKAKIVHADLSEFNILNLNERPVLIDFSQATSVSDYSAREYMERDIGNIVRFFRKIGVKKEVSDVIKRIM